MIGKDWLSVAVLPASRCRAGQRDGWHGRREPGRPVRGGWPAGERRQRRERSDRGALLKSATPVHGAWGSGQLLHTSLVSVLITNSGHVLVGAVTPAVL